MNVNIIDAGLSLFSLPLLRPLFNSRGAISQRRGVLLQIADESGLRGFGEATPLPGFGLETLNESVAALGGFLPQLIGQSVDTIPPVLEQFEQNFPAARCALSALDCALCDLLAKRRGISIAGLFCEKPLKDFPVNCLLSEQNIDSMLTKAMSKRDQGFVDFKLKVGAWPLLDDVECVQRLRACLGDGARIRLDANGAWSCATALRALEQLRVYDIEFIEQPVAVDDIAGLANLCARQMIPIAADESVVDLGSAERILAEGAADILMLKPSALGGPHRTMKIVNLAVEKGCSLVFSSLLDGAVARAMAAQLAAATPGVYAHGLATGEFFSADIASELKIVRGRMRLPAGPGLGVALQLPVVVNKLETLPHG